MRYLFYSGVIMLTVLTSGCKIENCSSEQSVKSDFHFSFDGQNDDCWKNLGAVCTGQLPQITGNRQAPSVRLSEGIRGNAFDGSHFIEKEIANCHQWGGGNCIDEYIIGARSFTVAMWISCLPRSDQGRLLKTPAFQINCRKGFLELAFGKPTEWFKSDFNRRFDVDGRWVFVAITYDCDRVEDNLKFYFSDTNGVYLNKSYTVSYGQLKGLNNECFLVIGNSEYDGNRPFVGKIDELRLWFSKEKNNSAALCQSQLEEVYKYDASSR